MIKLSRFVAFPWNKVIWMILSLLLLWDHSLLKKFLIQMILSELKKQSTLVFLWIYCILDQSGENYNCDFSKVKKMT